MRCALVQFGHELIDRDPFSPVRRGGWDDSAPAAGRPLDTYAGHRSRGQGSALTRPGRMAQNRLMYEFLHSPYGPLAAVTLVVLLALAAMRNSASDPAQRGGFSRAIALFAGYLLANIGAQVLDGFHVDVVAKYARVASYVLFSFGCVRLLTSAAVWLKRTRKGRVTPKIMVEVVDAVLYVVAVTVVLRVTLKVDIGALLATPAILSLVFGLALQETLGNLFAGLSLQAEPPFAVGDWITVGPHTGRVAQTTWRQTRIITFRNESVTIPNSAVAKEHVINFSRTGEGVARDLFVELDYDSPPNAVKEACLGVLEANPRIRRNPPPMFRVSRWGASGIQYQIRYFPDQFEDGDGLADEILTTLWYRVRREGFNIPHPTGRLVVERASRTQSDEPSALEALASVDFLRPCKEDALAQIAARSTRRLFGRGEKVVQAGERGETFFVVVSGKLSARRDDGTGEPERLGPGDFFGEMSLLADGPHAATVEVAKDATLVCVNREVFGEILRRHEGLGQAVAEILKARDAESKSATADKGKGSMLDDAKNLIGTVRNAFRLRS